MSDDFDKTDASGSGRAGKADAGTIGLRVLLVVAVLLAIGGVSYLVWQQHRIAEEAAARGEERVPDVVTTIADARDDRPTNPVDFAALWERNGDSYAWITIPGTDVNLPIQQSATDDLFYLNHAEDKSENVTGSLFTQLANSKDFSDPVTVIYGHDVDGQLKQVHLFEDADFFAEHDTFIIYTPGHMLTYTIVSAYQYDDRHILNSFDFAREDVRADYFAFATNPDSMLRNVREGVALDADSRIVQLSTCMLNEYHGNSRYILTGVLTNDQETK